MPPPRKKGGDVKPGYPPPPPDIAAKGEKGMAPHRRMSWRNSSELSELEKEALTELEEKIQARQAELEYRDHRILTLQNESDRGTVQALAQSEAAWGSMRDLLKVFFTFF